MSNAPDGRVEVHQYTRVETVRSMLSLVTGPVPQELWATSTPYMNDLREFEHGKRLFLSALKSLGRSLEAPHALWAIREMREIAGSSDGRNVFCACLSAKKDDLNQWRGYADNGRGCCVSYHYEELTRAFPRTAGWIVYDARAQRSTVKAMIMEFLSAVEPVASVGGLDRFASLFRRRLRRFLPTVFPFFKDPAFHEEQEFRIVYSPDERSESLPLNFRTDGPRLIPYVRLGNRTDEGPAALPLTCVTFGPGSKGPNNEAALRRLLDTRGLPRVEVKGSSIPFLPTG